MPLKSLEHGGAGGKPRPWWRRDAPWLGLILLLGLALRVWYLVQVLEAPDFEALRQDLDVQDYYARALAFGEWTPREGVTDPEMRTTPYYRPPGYSYYLAAIYWLSGGSCLAPRLVQMALGLVTVVLGYWLGRVVYHRVVGLLTAFFMATYWAFLYKEGEVNDPALFVFLAPVLILLMRWWSVRPGWRRAALLGICTAGYALMRPNILLFGPFMACWMAYVAWRQGRVRRIPASWAALLLATLAAIAPVTIRNYVVSGEFVPISTYFGQNLLIGNHPDADGYTPWLPYLQELEGTGRFSVWEYGNMVRGLGREVGNPALSHSEASAIFTRQALAHMRDDPWRVLALAWKKAVLFWAPMEITGNKVVQLEKDFYPPLKYLPGFPLPMALWLLGLGWLAADVWRGRLPQGKPGGATAAQMTALILLFVLVYYVSFLPFFVNARARIPVIGMMFLVGAYGLWRVGQYYGQRRWKAAMAWTAVVLLLFGFAKISWYDYTPDRARWRYARADSRLRQGEVEKAKAEVEAMLALPEWSPYMPMRLSRAFAQRGDLELARRLLLAAQDPGNPDYLRHHALGRELARLGLVDEAIAEYEQAIALNPQDAHSLNNLGVLLRGRGEVDRALALLERAAAARPDFALAHSNAAALQEERGAAEAALHHYAQAAQLEPGQQDYRYNHARLLAQSGQTAAALAEYEAARELNPEDPRTHCNMGLLLAGQGKHEAAAASYARALEAEPAFTLAHVNWGNLLAEQGRVEAAIAKYREGLAVAPEDPGLLNALGYLFARQGEHQQAMVLYEQALNAAPGFALAHNNLGVSLLALGDLEGALERFGEAAALAPADARARYNLADVLARLGRDAEALTHYAEAAEHDPANAAVWNDWANALFRLGRAGDALGKYEEALRRDPAYAHAHSNMAAALAALGRTAEAMEQLRKALAIDPDHETARANLRRLEEMNQDRR